MNKKLVLETTAPFQGLAELVAYDEGLFEKEGLTIEWVDRDAGVDKTPQLNVTSHKGVNPFASHGKLLEEGKADLYPRFGPTSEWDTAAGQALLEAAGGHVTRLDGHRLRYNCRESVINGDFLAFSHSSVLAKP